MPDRPTADERLDIIIDHGIRSLVEQNAPPGHVSRIRTRLAGRSRWAQSALIARLNLSTEAQSAKAEGRAHTSVAKGWAYMTAALLVAAVGAGVWVLRESNDDALETRTTRHARLQAPFAALPVLDLKLAARENVAAVRPLPAAALPSPEAAAARAAREAEASRARLMAYLDALYQLPPEVLTHEPPSAAEPLPEPRPIVIPKIVVTPLYARTESEDDALPDLSPRGEE